MPLGQSYTTFPRSIDTGVDMHLGFSIWYSVSGIQYEFIQNTKYGIQYTDILLLSLADAAAGNQKDV